MKYLIVLFIPLISSCSSTSMSNYVAQCKSICNSRHQEFVCIKRESMINWKGPISDDLICVCSGSEQWL